MVYFFNLNDTCLENKNTHPPHKNLFGLDKFQKVKKTREWIYELAFK